MKNGFLKLLALLSFIALMLPLFVNCTSAAPKFTLSSLAISSNRTTPGTAVTIAVNVLNAGQESDYQAVLKINDSPISSRNVQILAGETKTVDFQYTPTSTGTYSVDINGQRVSFEVFIPSQPAHFVTGPLNISPESPITGQELKASTTITNDGELAGSYKVLFKVGGHEISSKNITLDGGRSTNETVSYLTSTNGMLQLEFCGIARSVKVLKPAELKTTSLKISPTSVFVGDEVNIEAAVTNIGEAGGTMPLTLLVNGSEANIKMVTLDAGATTKVSFNFSPQTADALKIAVGDAIGSLAVSSLSKYANASYFYSIPYPQNYRVKVNSAKSVAIENTGVGNISIIVDTLSTNSPVSDYFDSVALSKKKQFPDWSYFARTDFSENGQIAGYQYEYSNNIDGKKWIGKGLIIKKAGLGFNVVFTTIESEWENNRALANACLKGLITPVASAGSYSNSSLGVALILAPEWTIVETGKAQAPLALFSPYNQPVVIGTLGIDSVAAGTTAQQYSDSASGALSKQGFQAGQKNTFDFTNNVQGYELYLTSTSVGLKMRTISLVNNNRAYSLVFIGAPQSVDSSANSLTQLAKTMVISTPMVAGVDKNESLFLLEGEIPTLDPTKTEDAPGDLAGALFSGLVRIDSSLKVVPDLAERWTISSDGKVYTFFLRKNAKYHDGKVVTASDVKYSWERACSPVTQSAKARYYLDDIVGAKDEMAGKSTGISGIKIIDDYTLEVTIDAAKQYFIEKLSQPVTYIVDQVNVAKGSYWFETPNGTGPFKLKSWQKNSQLVLERNETYYGRPAKLKNIVYKLLAGNSMQLYENGEIDRVSVSTANLDKVLDPANPLNQDLLTGSRLNLSYLGFNLGKAPFDDLKVRQAFALALDIPKIVEVSLKGNAKQAAGYLPEGIPGYNSGLQLLSQDVVKAKQLISESRYGSTDKLPPVTFSVLYSTTPTIDAIIGMLQQNLGVQIKVEIVSEYEAYLKRFRNREFQLFEGGWGADYIDPQNFLEILFQSQSSENAFAYFNSKVDSALTQAARESDEATRIRQYQDIEKLVLSDLPAVPLYRNTQAQVLVKPYIKGYVLASLNVNEWCDLFVAPH